MTQKSSKFKWSRKHKVAVASTSDLGVFCIGRLWQDSCDVGFVMTSDKNPGKVIRFCLSETKYDHNNDDVVSWTFEPYSRDLVQTPILAGYKVIVFND